MHRKHQPLHLTSVRLRPRKVRIRGASGIEQQQHYETEVSWQLAVGSMLKCLQIHRACDPPSNFIHFAEKEPAASGDVDVADANSFMSFCSAPWKVISFLAKWWGTRKNNDKTTMGIDGLCQATTIFFQKLTSSVSSHFWWRCFSRWWFPIFFIFTPTWWNDPNWLIFFKWVETTNTFFLPIFWPKTLTSQVLISPCWSLVKTCQGTGRYIIPNLCFFQGCEQNPQLTQSSLKDLRPGELVFLDFSGWTEVDLEKLWGWLVNLVWVVVSNISYFHPFKFGKWSNLTSRFFKWVGSIQPPTSTSLRHFYYVPHFSYPWRYGPCAQNP